MKFKDIRKYYFYGRTYYCAKDVCLHFGFSNVHSLVSRYFEGTPPKAKIDTEGGQQELTFIDKKTLEKIKNASKRKRKLESKQVFTYIIKSLDSGKIKIGKTTNLEKRMIAIKNSLGCNIEILKTFDEDLEVSLHDTFAEYRCEYGEWFNIPEEILVKYC